MQLDRICVYCGSRAGRDAGYRAAALALARLLGERGIDLVYGGARVGLMGALADAALANGTRVVGVIPRALVGREVAHRGLSELRVVESMHERKAMMVELADAFVALPGGLGTLEELLEAATWTQLGLHRKPCGLLNIAGFFDGLVAQLDHAAEQDFLTPEHRTLVLADKAPAALLDRLASWKAPRIS